MMRLVVLVLALASAGCDTLSPTDTRTADDFRAPLVCLPKHQQLPCASGVKQGVAYRVSLQTHCGIEWAYFDGRFWLPRPKVHRPSDWANIETGRMVLKKPGLALFEADKGGGARFVPAPDTYRPPPCA